MVVLHQISRIVQLSFHTKKLFAHSLPFLPSLSFFYYVCKLVITTVGEEPGFECSRFAPQTLRTTSFANRVSDDT